MIRSVQDPGLNGMGWDQIRKIFMMEEIYNDNFSCLDTPVAAVPAGPGFPWLFHSLERGWTPNPVPGAG